jgi:hypothetical protein
MMGKYQTFVIYVSLTNWQYAVPFVVYNVIIIKSNNLKSVLCLYESNTKISMIKQVCFPCKGSMLNYFALLLKCNYVTVFDMKITINVSTIL